MKSYIRAVLGREKAFTLMELLIVIAIIAILTVAFLPNALKAPAKARDAVKIKKVQDIQTAVEAYTAERGTPPASAASTPFCLLKVQADSMGIETPLDSSKSKSCNSTDTAASAAIDTAGANKYFYRYNATNKYYIVGAVMEVTTGANSDATMGQLESPPDPDAGGPIVADTLAAAKALIKPQPVAGGTYFLAVGPI